jgi:GNAT superfamily N-acetyltransferase
MIVLCSRFDACARMSVSVRKGLSNFRVFCNARRATSLGSGYTVLTNLLRNYAETFMQIPQSQVETKIARHCAESSKGDHWVDRLSDGTRVLIRPIRAEDRQLEKDFIMRLSPESKSFCFLGDFKQPSEALRDQWMDIDDPQNVVFIAIVPDNGQLREIGVSRFAVESDGRRCKCAIAVADDWNHRGLGVTLMKHLMSFARDKGVAQLFSIDSSNNLSMRYLSEDLGFTHHAVPDDATTVRYELDL